MRKLISGIRDNMWITLSILSLLFIVGYSGVVTEPAPTDDIDELEGLMDEFQDAYSNKRLSDLRQLFFADAVIAHDFDAGERQKVHSLEDWLQGTQEDVFDTNDYISDKLTNREIQVFRNIAYAVCDYKYVDDDEISRGVDIFTFMKMRDNWKILSLLFTGDEYSKD